MFVHRGPMLASNEQGLQVLCNETRGEALKWHTLGRCKWLAVTELSLGYLLCPLSSLDGLSCSLFIDWMFTRCLPWVSPWKFSCETGAHGPTLGAYSPVRDTDKYQEIQIRTSMSVWPDKGRHRKKESPCLRFRERDWKSEGPLVGKLRAIRRCFGDCAALCAYW